MLAITVKLVSKGKESKGTLGFGDFLDMLFEK
jgi:hypothetical protein